MYARKAERKKKVVERRNVVAEEKGAKTHPDVENLCCLFITIESNRGEKSNK
jgi:hypothetical protein